MRIPFPPEPEPAPVAAESDFDSMLDDELVPEPPVDIAAEMQPTHCPSCGAALAAQTVICAVCGYDARRDAENDA